MTIEKKDDNIIRQNIPRDPKNPVPHLSSGYPDNPEEQPANFYIPSCGIVDCDESVKKLFTKTLQFSEYPVYTANGAIMVKKPSVIFVSGERFAMIKRLRPLRDKNGSLILPAISIRNIGITQTYEDMCSRGINQTTGELIIKRRLDSSDIGYQQLINKLNLENINERGTSTRNFTHAKKEITLAPNFENNIWEIIAIPQPQYITCTYEITFWTTYTDHMNYLVETVISSQLPQVKGFKLTTESGYWFLGTLEDNIENKDNLEDFTDDKRIIRKSFNLNVKTFILPSIGNNKRVPVKRYISAPAISLDVYNQELVSKKEIERLKEKIDPFLLSDVLNEDTIDKQTPTTMEKYLIKNISQDPITGQIKKDYIKMLEKNGKETVYRATDPKLLQNFFYPSKR
jgi:hypothetical protein